MYIRYENRQYRSLKLYLDSSRNWHATPPGWTFGLPPPKSEFKPSFLVRVSDMQKIRGCEADEGYYALSYSWNQSGDIIKDGDEYHRTDDGRHKIVLYGITEKSSNIQRLFKFLTRRSKYVKFEGLIQRVCQNFGVKYIWYDQICINQLDPEDKKRELRQMHRIYGNAHCTIALIPDLEVSFFYHEWPKRRLFQLNGIRDKQWAKRLWTLEEAAMSKKVLFVGRNVHLWSHKSTPNWFGIRDNAFVDQICDHSVPWNAHSVLWHARRRTSTKPHDRIFAIANIFPDIVDEIEFNYKKPLIDLMIQFYCLLAKIDLSVLCFGAPIDWIKDSIVGTPEDDLLPSWTGSRGIHIRPSGLKTSFSDCSVSGTSLFVNCSYTHISIKPLVKFNRKGSRN
ncbi:hypothetical protein BJV82DRAFT_573535 [Fennellomyces sp. T-0311]|nr:hypothetical protein BJV82DRAFT_573535 [Fennellomyces sp. T-0311]